MIRVKTLSFKVLKKQKNKMKKFEQTKTKDGSTNKLAGGNNRKEEAMVGCFPL